MLKQFTTSLPDGTVVHWRAITWGEYRQLTSALAFEGPAIWHLYDAVAGLCVIDFECPIADEWDNIPAGVIAVIGEEILQKTGFVPTRELVQGQLNEARGRVQHDYYRTGVAYICSAFHYRPKEVDELTVDEFMDLLAMAEVALGADISIPAPEAAQQKFQEVIDPKTGKKIKVPLNTQRSMQQKNKVPG